jgi:zinc transport system substrate-binding protein
MKKFGLVLVCLLSSCAFWQNKTKEVKPSSLSKPLVIVSAAPYIEVVKQLAGDLVLVRSIIPPDVDPHNFEPAPKDMGPLLYTALWIQVGEEFEYVLENRLKETTPTIKILNLPKITKTLKNSCCNHAHHHHDHNHAHQNVDTHYWLDPLTVIDQAKAIAEYLNEISPENKAEFETNLKKLSAQLTNVNNQLQKELAPFKGNAFLTTHNAYGYFCNRYHLLQFGIEPSGGKEMRTKDIHYVIKEANDHRDDLICVLTQPQHVNRAAEIIAEKLGLPEQMVNPYEQDYISTIHKLAEIVVKYGKK